MPETTAMKQESVPVTPVREHLLVLKAAGATHALIAHATGLSSTTISTYTHPVGHPDARRALPAGTAARILGVTEDWVAAALSDEALLTAARSRDTRAFETTPIAPVREHLRLLKAEGATNAMIARQSGLSESGIANYLKGADHPRARSVVPREAAASILALSPAWARGAATDPTTDAAATRRRIATLTAAGHSARSIRDAIGGPIPTGSFVTSSRADAVTAAYDALAATQPRYQGPAERTEARLDAARARREGARLPHEWISIEHDRACTDPDPTINRAGIEAVCEGRWQRLTDIEYAIAIHQMRAASIPPTTITNRLRLPERTADRFLARIAKGERPNLADQVLHAADGSRKAPSGPAIAHIESLIKLGATPSSVARSAGLTTQTIKTYRGLNPRRPAPEAIHPEIAARILAVTEDEVDLDALIDAASTSRRLRALATRGFSAAMIGAATGIKPATIEHVHRVATTAVTTRNTIADFYDDVAFGKPPEYISDRQRGVAQAFRKRAVERGWRTPLDWDDIERGILAEPTETPAIPTAERLASQRDAARARQRIRDLCAAHWTHTQIAEATGISKTMVANYRRRSSPGKGAATRKMRHDIAARILAVEVDRRIGRGRVPAEPTRVLLSAELTAGTSLQAIANATRLSRTALHEALRARTVRHDIARTIASWIESADSAGSRKARRRPRPVAQLAPKVAEPTDVDEIAVELFLAGEPVTLTSAEQARALEVMYRRGDTVAHMQRSLGLNERSFAVLRSRALGITTAKAA